MENIAIIETIMVITLIGAIVALIKNWKSIKEENDKKAGDWAEVKLGIQHIKETLLKMDDLPNRVTILEQSDKAQWKELDRYRSGK